MKTDSYCSVLSLNQELSENSHTTTWVQAVQEWEPSAMHPSHLPACRHSEIWTLTAAEIPWFASKIWFFQIRYTQLSWEERHWRHCSGRKEILFRLSLWNMVLKNDFSKMLASVSQVKQCFPHSKSKHKRWDAYLHRYSKGSRICKLTASSRRLFLRKSTL